MQKLAADAEQATSIVSVAMAENEARVGNGAGAFQYLAKAGNWALNVATGIGTGVAVAASKAALGI